jgi:hypothetical protein
MQLASAAERESFVRAKYDELSHYVPDPVCGARQWRMFNAQALPGLISAVCGGDRSAVLRHILQGSIGGEV